MDSDWPVTTRIFTVYLRKSRHNFQKKKKSWNNRLFHGTPNQSPTWPLTRWPTLPSRKDKVCPTSSSWDANCGRGINLQPTSIPSLCRTSPLNISRVQNRQKSAFRRDSEHKSSQPRVFCSSRCFTVELANFTSLDQSWDQRWPTVKTPNRTASNYVLEKMCSEKQTSIRYKTIIDTPSKLRGEELDFFFLYSI